MLQGVGATFCSKTRPFFVCGPTKGAAVGVHVAVHILEKGPPPRLARNVLQILHFVTKFSAAKSGSISRLQVCLTSKPKPCPLDLEAKNGPWSARVCPKGSGPRSAAKQGDSLCVAPLNHGGPMRVPRSRAVFCSKTGPIDEGSKESGPCSAAKQGRSLCVAPLKCLSSRPKPCPWGLGSKNEPSSARVCPKGLGPRSAAKQGGVFSSATTEALQLCQPPIGRKFHESYLRLFLATG